MTPKGQAPGSPVAAPRFYIREKATSDGWQIVDSHNTHRVGDPAHGWPVVEINKVVQTFPRKDSAEDFCRHLNNKGEK